VLYRGAARLEAGAGSATVTVTLPAMTAAHPTESPR
jgi:hypothetical protein